MDSEQVVRECAFDIINIVKKHKDDNAQLIRALQDPLKRIVAQPDLLSLGVKRQGNHIDNSKYLYYDDSSSSRWMSFRRASASRRTITGFGKRSRSTRAASITRSMNAKTMAARKALPTLRPSTIAA